MNNETRILWIGSYQSKDRFEACLAKNIGQASGYAAQKGLIKGMDYHLNSANVVLDTISSEALTPYPKNPRIFIHKYQWHRTSKSYDLSIGFLNIKYLNYVTRAISLMLSSNKWLRKYRAKETEIFVYAPTIIRLMIAHHAQKKYKSKAYVFIPDIPELTNPGANKFIRKIKLLLRKPMKYYIQCMDGVIVYSTPMADYYQLHNNQWMLMEGVFDSSEALCQLDEEGKNKNHTILMYSGAITRHRGIPELLEAFEKIIDPNIELWFTGEGNCDHLVKSYMEKDPRIIHHGFIDSREQVLKLQSEADILIHTREIDVPSSSYCFPSKLFEYMVSGKPIISVKIAGIPKEYYNYLIPIEHLNSEEIYQAILHAITNKENLKPICKKARQFVLTEKNEVVQSQRILNFMNII